MDVSEDGIRGLRRFGGSSQSLSDLVDAEEVSRHLGITPRRVLSMARKGSIPCVRLSAKTIRFDIEAVDRALGGGRHADGALARAAAFRRLRKEHST